MLGEFLRGTVSQRCMWAFFIIVLLPSLGQLLGFAQGTAVVHLKNFITQATVERFSIAVLPRRTRFNVQSVDLRVKKPFLHLFGNEFRTIVGTYMGGNAVARHEFSKHTDNGISRE